MPGKILDLIVDGRIWDIATDSQVATRSRMAFIPSQILVAPSLSQARESVRAVVSSTNLWRNITSRMDEVI